MGNYINIEWNWEYMCGPGGLQVWNDTAKDFGPCFQELFLQIPLHFLLAIVSAYYVGYRKDWVIREKYQERVLVVRCFAVLALVFIPIIELYLLITQPSLNLYPVDYFACGTASISWLVHFSYVLALKHRLGASARGPMIQLVLWSTTVLLSIFALHTSINTGVSLGFQISILCCHALYFFTLLPSSDSRPTYYSRCLVGSQHSHSEYTPLLPHADDNVLGTAMQGIGYWSKLTFSWVNPLFQKGLENKLGDPEELFDLPAKYRCSYVGAKLDRALIGNVDHYQQFTEVPHEPFISPGYGAVAERQQPPESWTPVTPTSRVLVRPPRRQNVTLLRALHTCFAAQFYSIGLLKLVSDMAAFAGPLLLNKLVNYIEDDTIDDHLGYMYAGGLLAAMLISTLFNVHFNWLMSIIGIKMRGAIIASILTKTLSVTSTELTKSFSVGEITNFMSTDLDRIVNSCPSFHALWSIPLQLCITLFLLYQQVGVSILAGVAFSVILIPINKVIANKIGHLSTEMMKHKDTRVSIISDLLRGIRTVKVHVWEDYFTDKISEARSEELRYLRLRKYLDAICVVFWATTPVLVAALTLGTHALRGQPLGAATVFTTVALINMLIAPLNAFPWVLNGLTEAWVSIKRIQNLLNLTDMEPEIYYDKLNINNDEDKVIILKNASFAWAKPRPRPRPKKSRKNKGKSKKRLSVQRRDSYSSTEVLVEEEPFMLKELSLEIGKGEFVGIVGTVASGKSSLLLAVIGEMIKKGGDIQVPDNLNGFGYVSQKPWLIRGTVRDNILFGKPYDEAKFRSVIDACCLTEDLNTLGWNTYVGEGGCTLSGGQRARISLARAVYQEKQVYLLDDILSGLDGAVSQQVLQRCVLGLLRHTTRVLVTHSPRHLSRASQVILLANGQILKQGPPEIVLNDIEEYLPSDTESIGEEQPTRTQVHTDTDDNVSRSSLEQEEGMSQGTVSWWVIGLYLRAVGVFLTVAIIISLVLMQVSQNFTFLCLAFWVKNRTKNTTTLMLTETYHDDSSLMDHGLNVVNNIVHTVAKSISDIQNFYGKSEKVTNNSTANAWQAPQSLEIPLTGVSAMYNDNFFLWMYFGLAGLNLVFTIMRAFLFAYGGVKAASKIHKYLLKSIIMAKVKFFDTTPTGRILNRFSSDTYTVDDTLPFIMNILLAQVFSLIGAVGVTVFGLPWVMVAVAPLCALYLWLQRRYRVTSRQLRRLQSVTLSPVYAHFNDTLEGLSTLRGAGQTSCSMWARRGQDAAEVWQRAALAASAAQQWLAVRLQAPAAALAAAAALVAVLQRTSHAANAGMVGLALSYALSMTSMLSNVLNSFTETEREMIAVERVGEYITQVESEKFDGDPPPYGWPSQGVVTFDNVYLKYRSGPTAERWALRGVSLSTFPCEKLGVVGRTGAGKSSLLAVLLRLTPPAAGNVTVDGVDLATIHLTALRSRIGMIPQEPFLVGGSVRENIDPLRQYHAAEVSRAADAVGLSAALETRGGLDAPAKHLSRGTQQLLCLARALLQRPKVLLVDEATANLDVETERVILDTIWQRFAGSTVIYVAHRVAGVTQCNRALVMSGGQVKELRPVQEALSDPTSCLYSLAYPDSETRPDEADWIP